MAATTAGLMLSAGSDPADDTLLQDVYTVAAG
jgi:hypothetical protein